MHGKYHIYKLAPLIHPLNNLCDSRSNLVRASSRWKWWCSALDAGEGGDQKSRLNRRWCHMYLLFIIRIEEENWSFSKMVSTKFFSLISLIYIPFADSGFSVSSDFCCHLALSKPWIEVPLCVKHFASRFREIKRIQHTILHY